MNYDAILLDLVRSSANREEAILRADRVISDLLKDQEAESQSLCVRQIAV